MSYPINEKPAITTVLINKCDVKRRYSTSLNDLKKKNLKYCVRAQKEKKTPQVKRFKLI